MGGLRLSQCAHMLYNLAATSHTEDEDENDINEKEWLRDVTDNFCTEEGQQRVFQMLFSVNYNSETSMVYNCKKFSDVSAYLAVEEDLIKYDTSAVMDLDLQTWVWMGVQWRKNLGNSIDPFSWISTVFEDLPLTIPASMKLGNIWNLCQLDVEAFIVGCVLYAEKGAALWQSAVVNPDKFSLSTAALPMLLCRNFVTPKQNEWWSAACKLHYRKNREKIFNANQLKATLRHGIEALRGSGNHGLQLALITGLANHFSAKAYAIDKSGLGTSSAAWLAYQRRAASYWTLALPLLLDLASKRSRHRTEPLDRLFPGTLSEPTIKEARSMLSEVYMCNGSLLVQEGDLKKALETYAKADTPHASFSEALIYKQLFDNMEKKDSPQLLSSATKRKETLMRKFATKLEVTLNRLEYMPDEELQRRAETMLHDSVETTSLPRPRLTEQRRLFDETIPKQIQQQNETLESEVGESLLPGPSRQSTPKDESRPDSAQMNAEVVSKFAQSLTAITTCLSNFQINFNERLNKVEQTNSPKPDKDDGDKVAMQTMMEKLEKLTTQLDSIQEQVSRTSLGTPVAPNRAVQLAQSEGMPPPTHHLQQFDQVQQPAMASLGSPLQNPSPFYNLPPYHGYMTPQSPSMGPMYPPAGGFHGNPGMPPLYQPGLVDPRVRGSPIGTPPLHFRPQHPHPSQLPISKEAAEALSIRFQATLREKNISPGVSVGPPVAPPDIQARIQEAGPEAFIQHHLGPSQSGGALVNRPGFVPLRQPVPQPGIAMPQLQRPTILPRPNLPPSSLDGTYTPPNGSTMAAQGESTLLKSLLASGPAQKEPGIQYPAQMQFPAKPVAQSTPWNFKFETPEEMDKANKKLEADEEAEDAEASHNDTGPHFEPLVTLPEIEVVTGEEDEEEMFAERAKLYRYTEGEWKERGLGVMKILKHKDSGKHRLLMRRDQILKICCNHIIAKETKLEVKSDKSWTWNAFDYSEGTQTKELFAIRFKTVEIAKSFQNQFIESQKENIAIGSPAKPKQTSTTVTQATSTPPAQATSSAPTQNTARQQGKPSLFGGIASKFSLNPTSEATSSSPALVTSNSPIGSLFGGSKFAMSPAALNLAARISGTPTRKDSENEKEEDGNEEEDPHNRTGDGPHFEPIIPLPDKVETKTGEEGEEVLFCNRAKLYRYADKQWKERGLGDLKILHNKDTNKCRIVMRREQVLKLCANHYIVEEMKLLPMSNSNKAWMWFAMDFSDPDSPPQQEQLAARFKSAETAVEFQNCFNKAKEIIKCKNIQAGQTKFTSSTPTKAVQPSKEVSKEQPQGDDGLSGHPQGDGLPKGKLIQKKAVGSWSCSGCYSDNEATEAVCPCCNTPNPNAPKTAASAPQPSSGTGFSFGIKSSQPTSGFSFGVKQSDTSAAPTFGIKPSQGTSGFSFGSPSQPPPSSFTFGAKPNTAPQDASTGFPFGTSQPASGNTQPSKPFIFGSNSASSAPPVALKSAPAIQTFAASGRLVAEKKPGVWTCQMCYTENEPADQDCVCCQTPNPNAPPKANEGSQAAAVFGMTATTSTGISFGVPQKNLDSKTGLAIVNIPDHSLNTPGSSFLFGTKPQSGTPVFGGQSTGNSVFGNVSSSTLPKPNFGTTDGSPKPSFPTVDVYEEGSEEYSEGTTNTDEEESYADSDESYNSDKYRSPMSRGADKEDGTDTINDQDSDVICLGEVLPSLELQKRAEDLMLPKHFYNFVKPGQDVDDSPAETEDEIQRKEEDETSKDSPKNILSKPAESIFGQASKGDASSSTLFSNLANSSIAKEGFAFGNTKSDGWIGMGEQKPLFANLRQDDDSAHDDSELYNNEENADIHFEPIVKLPDKVETVTGEEDEETLYSQRCKLYRYFKPTGEWKERGLGDLKILRHMTTGRIRIVMRREQVLKVCANHYIKPGMTLEPNKSSDKAWTWNAVDHSDEGEPQNEMFTARFKTTEIAAEFKNMFDHCQTMLLDADPLTPCKASSLRNKELSDKAEKMKNELRFFKDKFSEPSKIDLHNTLTEGSAPPQTLNPIGRLTPLVAQHASQRESSTTQSNSQGIQKPKSLFPENSGFTFQIKKSETQKEADDMRGRKHIDSVCSDDPQAENHEIQFSPIVKLPEVDLVTGEEDEQVIFGNRAKLYGFHRESKQWKERGTGDVKILQHLTTFKSRVIMRRDQVFKVCLNHLIKPEIRLSFKNPKVAKTLIWTATDYSDADKPNGEVLQFALRFKSSESATVFKDLWEESAVAAQSGVLMDPNIENVNLSVAASVTSPGPVALSPESPVKQPTSTFSFANIPSPFSTAKKSQDGPVEVAGFVFGKPDHSMTSTPASHKFNFDVSKMSLAFGSPQVGYKGSGSVFGTPSESSSKSDPKANASNNLYTTAFESLTDLGKSPESGEPKAPEPTPLFGSGMIFGANATSKGYKPSPLVTGSIFSAPGTQLSTQNGSKFQFKPTSSETEEKDEEDSKDDDDDVICLGEILPTNEQQARARELQLPKSFYLYEFEQFKDFDEKLFEENEEKILQFLEDRDSGKLEFDGCNVSGEKTQEIHPEVDTPHEDHSVAPAVEDEKSVPEQSTFSTLPAFASLTSSDKVSGNIFGGKGSTSASFSDLAAGVKSTGFKADPNFQFPGAGQVMFQFQDTENSEEQDPSQYQCEAQFKPVLDELPPLIEVKTGEEGEQVLFKERCKLYGYDKVSKSYKERGVGEIKLLRNDEHKLHRVVMRRDQVLKVCTNHVIGEGTQPEHHLGNPKTCTYFITDYSESKEPVPAQIVIRFKTEDICKAYMNVIEEVKTNPEFG